MNQQNRNPLATRRPLAAAAALALAFGLAACSVGSEPSADGTGTGSGLRGSISGAGASSQQAAMQTWQVGFLEKHPDAVVDYDPIGSGGGRTQFLSGGVQFAGSDAYLKDSELEKLAGKCHGGEVIEAPVYISPIAVAYNIEGVDQLKLDPATIAKIFSGAITNWNDPVIAAQNPGVTFPDLTVTPVHRSDESGTTENFTEYLAKTAPEHWTAEPSGKWPTIGGEAAKGTSGVVQAISGGNGTIGYVDVSQAGRLGHVHVKVGEEYVPPTPEAAAKIIDASPQVQGRPQHSLALDIDRNTTAPGTYPVVLASYALACTKYPNDKEAELVKEWMTYIFSEEGQAAAQQYAGSAPITERTRERAMAGISTIAAAE